jgi:predicted nucleic acid-binding protein
MNDKTFLDTNVLIYAIALSDPRRERARDLLAQGGVISVQVLNEFAFVTRRKLQMPWGEVKEALQAVQILCPEPAPITIDTHQLALRIAERYRYGVYDGLIAASALETGCATLFSEDLQNGQVIDDRLTIRNPFA